MSINPVETPFMQRAIDLARKGVGSVRPNPPVGAVIVRGGEVVGEGFHKKAGGPHAEVVALAQAGEQAKDATLYVTLEPCNHVGLTPPCTEAIIAAGIREVFYGVADPNPHVEGGGHKRLEEAGIDVRSGVLEAETRTLIRYFEFALGHGRPFVIAKYAASLDGRIASRTGQSKWITGKAARRRVHELRKEVDAIMVGAGTAVMDNPRLSVRVPGFEDPGPARIVLDSAGCVPAESRVFDPAEGGPAIVAATSRTTQSHRKKLVERGVQVWIFPEDDRGRVSIDALISELGNRGFHSVLVEGGSNVLGSMFDGKLVDEVWAFLAPTIIGGDTATASVGGLGVQTPENALRLGEMTVEQIGGDILVRGRLPRALQAHRDASQKGGNTLEIHLPEHHPETT